MPQTSPTDLEAQHDGGTFLPGSIIPAIHSFPPKVLPQI
jgi:hypothetical protein